LLVICGLCSSTIPLRKKRGMYCRGSMHNKAEFQRCSICVLDNKLFDLEFDAFGQCDACADGFERQMREWSPGEPGRLQLEVMSKKLKAEGVGKKYDAIIGLSGGIDSAYLAHIAVKDMGLRVLAVHVDAGWNSSAAVRNIERMVCKLGIDLYTHVVEWSDIADLQYAFLKAGVFNQDLPQDHAFFSTLYRVSNTFGIGTFLSGVNYVSESVSPRHSGPSYLDGKHIRAIHKRHGRHGLKRMKMMSLSWYLVQTKLRKRPRILKPLDLIDYDKDAAKAFLLQNYDWTEYGEKHSESRFTKFYQEVYLPRKFGFDKRQLHLSSLIVSGKLKREDALAALEKPICSPQKAKQDTAFVAKKLGISYAELESELDKPPKDHSAYPSNRKFVQIVLELRRRFRTYRGT
jgi:N-acetyl sugar amidotransferase